MNYYNPYYTFPTYMMSAAPTSRGLLGGISAARGIRSGINWGTILNNIQRGLGIANQAIPVIKQVTPVMRNAKTMFQVMNEFKKVDTPISNERATTPNEQMMNNGTNSEEATSDASATTQTINNNGPVFFI